MRDNGRLRVGSTKITKKAYASAPFVILRDLIKGVERSEQNNPVSCFVNGDRRILRDITKNQIQNIEQNSRTTPLGSTKITKKAYASAPFVILRDLIKGVERSDQNNPVSCFVNGDRRILRDVTKNQIQNIEQNSRTTPLYI